MKPFVLQRKRTLLILGTSAAVIVGLAAIPAYDALLSGKAIPASNRAISVALVAGLFGLIVSAAAVLCLRRVDCSPLGRLTASVQDIVESEDYSRSLAKMKDPELDEVGAQVNRLIGAVRRRNEAIERHEDMERNLNDWLKKRGVYEEELKEARLAADIANRTKSLFLASVSHELRTPLHTIMNYARFGMEDAGSDKFEDAAEFFEIIHDSGDLLLLLVNDLLDLSKLELGRMSFRMLPTSFGDVVGCALDQFQVSLRQGNLTVVTDLQRPDVIMVDATRTVQVVRNLIENAIKFTRPDSSILVGVSESDDKVTLCVRDQGEGVPDEELDMIFESFRQSSKAKVGDGGVGLGLAIARQLVTAQKGRMWAENHVDGGLAVFVQFELCEVDRPNANAGASADQEHQFMA